MSALTIPFPAADCETLGELYRRHHARILRLCRYLLGSMEEAEDAAHEIFLRLPKALETYDRKQPLGPWLSRVTSNYCLDLLRRRHSERRLFRATDPEAPEAAAPTLTPFELYLQEEKKDKVREVMAGLPEHYRRPLMQRYWGGLGYHEIARNLGLTRANVGTLIFRAKEAVRRTLAMEGSGGRPAGWAWDSTR